MQEQVSANHVNQGISMIKRVRHRALVQLTSVKPENIPPKLVPLSAQVAPLAARQHKKVSLLPMRVHLVKREHMQMTVVIIWTAHREHTKIKKAKHLASHAHQGPMDQTRKPQLNLNVSNVQLTRTVLPQVLMPRTNVTIAPPDDLPQRKV